MSAVATVKGRSPFNHALSSVEALALEDQEALVDLVQRRIAAERRKPLVREVVAARKDYRGGKVKRGSAAELMAELRRA